jgi:hypothetical protein
VADQRGQVKTARGQSRTLLTTGAETQTPDKTPFLSVPGSPRLRLAR